MPFIIPNAVDFGVSIASLEQAEPDKLDFVTLGDRRSGVISGGNATTIETAPSAYIAVTLSAAEVMVAGTYVASIAGTTVTIDSPATDTRFDIICADSSTGTFTVEKGEDSATNPIFPTLSATQVPLYAVIVRTGLLAGGVTRLVVDKRTLIGPTINKSGTATPTGGVSGDIYYRTGSTPATGQSTVWVNNAGTWENLAKYVPAGTSGTSNVVLRDSSGDFSAGTVTANVVGNVTGAVTGNAQTASEWSTARTLTVTGDVTGSVSVKGNAAMSLALTTTVPRNYVQALAPPSPKAGDLWIQV
jgi:hypothetical protein